MIAEKTLAGALIIDGQRFEIAAKDGIVLLEVPFTSALRCMVKGRIYLRYQLKESNLLPTLWSVVDTFTGHPAVVRGVPLDCMTAEEADDAVILMNHHDLYKRGIRRPTQ